MRTADIPGPRLDDSRARIRRHRRTPYEHVFSAMVYCLKHGDDEAAALLSRWLVLLDEEERWEKF